MLIPHEIIVHSVELHDVLCVFMQILHCKYYIETERFGRYQFINQRIPYPHWPLSKSTALSWTDDCQCDTHVTCLNVNVYALKHVLEVLISWFSILKSIKQYPLQYKVTKFVVSVQ